MAVWRNLNAGYHYLQQVNTNVFPKKAEGEEEEDRRATEVRGSRTKGPLQKSSLRRLRRTITFEDSSGT
jgi:hypothetical protein